MYRDIQGPIAKVGPLSAMIHDYNFLPLYELSGINAYLKIEAMNPSGSIKMKAALGMISDLENRNVINEDTILIESSSGSLGVALSIICAERGYQFVCVVDPNAMPSNIRYMKALGTRIVMIEHRDINGGFLGSRISYIKGCIAEDQRYVWLNQYENHKNPAMHANTTATAITDTFDKIDYLFIGAGTTGTLMGCLQHFATLSPDTRIIAVDSIGSVTFGVPPGRRVIPGLGSSHRPGIYQPAGIYAFELIPEAEAVMTCRQLARRYGLLAGGSTGTVMSALYKWHTRIEPGSTVVAISPDFGERYLDTIYNDEWVNESFELVTIK
ncbi:2,3-diaminopropionate biosynthesis protein SbnA [Aeromonas cavernicola]|uniref:2,3-diaminopropionate biosynthesis protein SbnA n=1 Tax=Aeromonas cavernicola TaxID=1006623 RepID=UPI00191C832F|nr:2,3-diaminopropionate biosynthesis protein SbnA [Aeromonas cavernicola]